jgi:hypothetical protein
MSGKLLKLSVSIYVSFSVIYFVLLNAKSDEFPYQAELYQSWWASQPLSSFEQAFSYVGLVAWGLSLMAALVLLFKVRYARLVFAVSILAMLVAELSPKYPILVISFQGFLDSAATAAAGVILGVVYSVPESAYTKK